MGRVFRILEASILRYPISAIHSHPSNTRYEEERNMKLNAISNIMDYCHVLYLSYCIFISKKEGRVVKIGVVEFIDHFVPMMEAYTLANVC